MFAVFSVTANSKENITSSCIRCFSEFALALRWKPSKCTFGKLYESAMFNCALPSGLGTAVSELLFGKREYSRSVVQLVCCNERRGLGT
jgi:hypothetical protein